MFKDHHRCWGTAKSLCGIRTSRSLPTLVFNGSPVSSPLDKAECLNNFLLLNVQPCPLWEILSLPLSTPQLSMQHFRLNPSRASMYWRSWKSPGPDLITNKMLKECAGETALLLPSVHIFNCSLKTRIFPSSWKGGACSDTGLQV